MAKFRVLEYPDLSLAGNPVSRSRVRESTLQGWDLVGHEEKRRGRGVNFGVLREIRTDEDDDGPPRLASHGTNHDSANVSLIMPKRTPSHAQSWIISPCRERDTAKLLCVKDEVQSRSPRNPSLSLANERILLTRANRERHLSPWIMRETSTTSTSSYCCPRQQ